MKKINLDSLLQEAEAQLTMGEFCKMRALVAIAAELREMNERAAVEDKRQEDIRKWLLDADERDYRDTCNAVRPGGV